MRPFHDITLCTQTPFTTGDPQYYEDTALVNYVSDLYIRFMYGYKPPDTTGVSIEAGLTKRWQRPWKDGSLRMISAIFDYDQYSSLDKKARYKYILDIIQECMLGLCGAYNWDKSVFDLAYSEVIKNDFIFEIAYDRKQARNKKASAKLLLRKTEKTAQILALIRTETAELEVELVNKKNWWWFDSTYKLVKNYQWFDNHRFGMSYNEAKLKIWYDISKKQVFYQLQDLVTTEFDSERVLKF